MSAYVARALTPFCPCSCSISPLSLSALWASAIHLGFPEFPSCDARIFWQEFKDEDASQKGREVQKEHPSIPSPASSRVWQVQHQRMNGGIYGNIGPQRLTGPFQVIHVACTRNEDSEHSCCFLPSPPIPIGMTRTFKWQKSYTQTRFWWGKIPFLILICCPDG